jgi:hypothetical protein
MSLLVSSKIHIHKAAWWVEDGERDGELEFFCSQRKFCKIKSSKDGDGYTTISMYSMTLSVQ